MACHLQCLDALRLEIANAIGAIAANALDRLQDSIAKQETLCFRLQLLASTDAAHRREELGGATYSQASKHVLLRRESQESYRMLCAISLEYAAVLRHSGKTITLLDSLCRGYLGAFPSVSGGESDRPMWFCEA